MELTKDEVFVRDYLAKLYPQLEINARKTAGTAFDKHGYDLISVAVEYFLKKPLETQLEAIRNNKAENFITFIMAMQLKSGSSHFYHNYRKFHEKQREFYPNYKYKNRDFDDEIDYPEEDPAVTCIRAFADKLDPYEKMVFNEIIVNKTKLKDIKEKYNINYHHLSKDAKELRIKFRRVCQKFL